MTSRIEILVEIARSNEPRGKFLVRRHGDPDWVRFNSIEDALVDVSLELRERGILVSREPRGIEVIETNDDPDPRS